MLGSGLNMVVTGGGGPGFHSGEGASEIATTSKEGSRHANYQLLKQRGRDEIYWEFSFDNLRNVVCINVVLIIYWRESLVPAAAVIPAPKVYTKFAVVKMLVVDPVIISV